MTLGSEYSPTSHSCDDFHDSHNKMVENTNECVSTKRQLAPWLQPENNENTRGKLHLMNSLTRKKELFLPQNGNQVSWYICGPTVYDSAHMGHARSYISFDILRRVLQNYFGYDVNFVMNVTDIDDKIIKRARQHYLMERYLKNEMTVQKVIDDVLAALIPFKVKFDNETSEDKKVMLETLIAKVSHSVGNLEVSLRNKDTISIENAKNTLITEARDVLSDWLDMQFGSTVNDHSIFMELARKFEAEFYSDMKDLNVLPADVVTRVSEYVPEIITFIEKIISNGYAYESNGSVYFNTVKFDQRSDHHYAKLVPEAYADSSEMCKALKEGEGELCDLKIKSQEKVNITDFALWKASKAGEPFWSSPWGNGRPGWHIECSVMATAICGPTLDIHAGGFDLKFPHHDNEIAQTEAHFEHDQWVNYFLHAGTLKIAGLKMSKSLKNFITIKDALKQYSARQLRLLFLFHNWADVLDYSPSTMEGALNFEKTCNEFFLSTKFYVRQYFRRDDASTYVKFHEIECNLNEKFTAAKSKVHDALCDSVDTRTVVEALKELISAANVYVNQKNSEHKTPNILLIRNIALYVTSIMKMFGVSTSDDEIGFGEVDGEKFSATGKEDLLMPYVQALTDFRERVRQIAIGEKFQPILAECDRLRNDVLPQLGVRLEDRKGHTMVKLCDPETLIRERQQEIEQEQKIRLEKELKRQEAAVKEAEREAKRKIPPKDMFIDEKDKYSKFDDKGIPTHDDKGAELSKGSRKKLEKLYAQQEQKYNEYLEAKTGLVVNGVATNGHDKN